ncbi:MAG: glycosyltransferase family 9 protein [Endomicrobia bacterium]|nr:glycosyltransferase family 9 protein [Endomicrobiia bacterium]MCL2506468.1 glycosyltransferase family 9 protein [Endomicrobiia bacterium]
MNKNFTVYTDCANFPLDRPCKYQKNDNAVCDKCDKYVSLSKTQGITRILIIKLGAMGDVLRTTFILEGLKQNYPESEISWIVSKKNAAVLEDNSFINNIIYNDEKTPEYLALNYFDIVVNLDLAPESLALAKLSNNSKILGYVLDNKRNVVSSNSFAADWLKMSAYDELKKANTYTYQHWMSKIVEIPKDNYEIIVPLSKESVQKAENFLKENKINTDKKIIGINPGAGKRWPLKKWTTKGFIDVAKYFSAKGHIVLLLGGMEDKEEIDAILAEKINNVYSSGVNNSIPDFFALINLCGVILCGDTMALHAAAGLKKSIVALFGPTSFAEIEIYSRGTKIRSSKDCLCCYKQNCDIKNNCMESIPKQEVIEAIERQITINK